MTTAIDTNVIVALWDGMGRKPIRVDVKGAPFKMGDWVRVIRGSDDTFDPSYKGRVGIVEYFEYGCGCGQSYPHDPMIGVRFYKTIAEFWKEELIRSRVGLRYAHEITPRRSTPRQGI
jgi:CarS bacterial SH3 domain